MEQEQDPGQPLFDLQIDYDSGNTIRNLSKWAKFIAITYFVLAAAILIAFAFVGAKLVSLINSWRPGLTDGLGVATIGILVLMLAVYVFINVHLYLFADKVKKAVERQDQQLFNDGLKSFKIFLLTSGVLALLALLFNIVTVIIKAAGVSLLPS